MLIAIDLDEVLTDFTSNFIEFHNKKYGTSLKRKDFVNYRYWDILGITKEEAIRRVYEFYETDSFQNMPPLTGSKEALISLKKKHKLIIITSRPDDIVKITEKWVDKFFPETFSKLYFTNHLPKNGIPRKKEDVCSKLGVDILIEDVLEFAVGCASEKTKVLLLTCPWNEKYKLLKGIYRVKSWKEIVEKVNELTV
jgi:uncharacterized HAD superfamily protein